MESQSKVSMVGLGYIGLPTAALIASKNIKVSGVDVNRDVVKTINEGKIHIVEPDLDKVVANVVHKKLLQASTQVQPADVYIITVPTPIRDNNQPDISYVEAATRSIIPHLKAGDLFIIESTSPVGTTEKMRDIIFTERAELKGKIHLAYCPERVLPGNILFELEHNDRAIGGIDSQSTQKAIAFYQQFVTGDLYPTNARTAEMVKLVENASRDVQIAFANELSIISDKAGIDVWELIELANKHPRVNILRPGTGVGGHCIAVDPWFIVSEFSEEAKIIRTAREINNYKTEWVIEKIKNTIVNFELNKGRKPKIAVMGIAFKPDIDDLRESPSMYVARVLQMQKYDVSVVEPNIKHSDEFNLTELEQAIEHSDILAFLVGHKEFKALKLPENKVVLDFVNVHK